MKLDILFHYEVNEQTGEIKFIGKEEIVVDTAVSTKRQSTKAHNDMNDTDPLIKLDSNKLILTSGAVKFMNLNSDCRLDIKYKKEGNTSVPVIGTDAAFGTKGGNKLTKNNTVSFRGSANEKLAEFGSIFTLESSDSEGIFYLRGDKPVKNPLSDEIDITSELDIESLDSIDMDDELELGSFDFTL